MADYGDHTQENFLKALGEAGLMVQGKVIKGRDDRNTGFPIWRATVLAEDGQKYLVRWSIRTHSHREHKWAAFAAGDKYTPGGSGNSPIKAIEDVPRARKRDKRARKALAKKTNKR